MKFIQDGREYFSSGFACVSMTACSGVHDGHPDIILLRKMVPTSVWQLLKLLDKLVGVVAVPPGRAIPNPGSGFASFRRVRQFFLRALRFFLCHNTAGFHGLH